MVVFVPATKKEVDLFFNFVFFGPQEALSTPPYLPSLAARSGFDALAARTGALGKTLTEFLDPTT